MIRIVVDTNVLISAVIAPNGNEARLLKLLRDGSIRACVNEDILAEYQQVLLREKFGYAARTIAPLLKFLHEQTEHAYGAPTDLVSPDPTDTKFITCGVVANADYIVTGNLRDFPESAYGTAIVVNGAEFLNRIESSV